MLSDEEKKAIEEFEKLKNYKHTYYGYTWFKVEVCADNEMKKNIDIILNLIEKQSKEIEHQKLKRENQRLELAILNAKQVEFNKLVNTVNSYKGQFKKQQKEIEELKNADLTIVYLNGVYDGEKKVNDKIKAKIEELEKGNKNTFIRGEKILVLQSLLEKE